MKATLARVLTRQQIEVVVKLAQTIWTEHYTPIIGKDQVTYMLRTYHSFQTISNEVDKKNIHYYLIMQETKTIGYMGIRLDDESLFLSKIYLLEEEREHGLGSQAISFAKELASSHQLPEIRLTVNKNNTNAITAYKHVGFEIVADICTDIGEGYVMDDHVMVLKV